MDQALNSQKTPHTSPLRASYGMSFVSILMKNDRVIKGFYCMWHANPLTHKAHWPLALRKVKLTQIKQRPYNNHRLDINPTFSCVRPMFKLALYECMHITHFMGACFSMLYNHGQIFLWTTMTPKTNFYWICKNISDSICLKYPFRIATTFNAYALNDIGVVIKISTWLVRIWKSYILFCIKPQISMTLKKIKHHMDPTNFSNEHVKVSLW